MPSTIPESPAFETTAMAAGPQDATAKVPSPLANEILGDDAAPLRGPPPRSISGTQSPPESVPATTIQPTQVVPVVVDGTNTSKAEIAPVLTGEPESISSPQAAAPSAPSSRSTSKSATPSSALVTPAVLSRIATHYFGDIPRSTTLIGLDSEPDVNTWADHAARATANSESSSEASRGRVLTDQPSKSPVRPRVASVASSRVALSQISEANYLERYGVRE